MPSQADLADSTSVYAHDNSGPGGADRVEILRHPSGDYIHRAWGVDPDHGDYDRASWLAAGEAEQCIARERESQARLRAAVPARPGSAFRLVLWGLVVLACVVWIVAVLVGF